MGVRVRYRLFRTRFGVLRSVYYLYEPLHLHRLLQRMSAGVSAFNKKGTAACP